MGMDLEFEKSEFDDEIIERTGSFHAVNGSSRGTEIIRVLHDVAKWMRVEITYAEFSPSLTDAKYGQGAVYFRVKGPKTDTETFWKEICLRLNVQPSSP